MTFCWAVAGRTLVRELAFKKEAQDELGEATLKQEVWHHILSSSMDCLADCLFPSQISVILSAMRMFSQRESEAVFVRCQA